MSIGKPTPKFFALFSVLLLSIGVNVGLFAHNRSDQTSAEKEQSQSQQLPLISKRLFVENPNDILLNFVKLRKSMNDYIDGSHTQIGVYFEYLPSGVSIGVNSGDTYLLASLLKVPIIMAVYNGINTGQLDSSQMLTIQPEDLDNKFGTLWQKGAGTKLSVKDAITAVLTESDNTAKNALLHLISMDDLADVFDYLDIPKESEEDGPIVTPKNYSSILRSLYLSSYLPKEQSNEILEIMTHAMHTDRLRAGVPDSVLVSHKIGVYEKVGQEKSDIYTDCGIVYAPKRPYILCIMTRSSFDEAKTNMSAISKMVYDYVSTANQ